MGVLKVPDGTGWRNVGCGGTTGSPGGTQPAVTELYIADNLGVGGVGPANPGTYLRRNGVELVNNVGAVFSGSDAPGGAFTLTIADNRSITQSYTWNLVDPTTRQVLSGGGAGGYTAPYNGVLIDSSWPGTDTLQTIPAVPATVGRFKVWDGSRWWQEVSDAGAAATHPLKAWDGSTWQTVACMFPMPGSFDSAVLDDATYG